MVGQNEIVEKGQCSLLFTKVALEQSWLSISGLVRFGSPGALGCYINFETPANLAFGFYIPIISSRWLKPTRFKWFPLECLL